MWGGDAAELLLFKEDLFTFIMCMSVSSAHRFVHDWCLHGSEEGTESPGNGVTYSCQMPDAKWVLGTDPNPL